jgi:hypothetical protein
MRTANSLSVTVAQILTTPAPLLVADTCSVLDVTRSLYRPEAPSRSLGMGKTAVRASASHPPKLHIVLFDEIEQELQRNSPGEIARLRTQMIKLSAAGDVSLSKLSRLWWRYCVRKTEGRLAAFPDAWKEAGHRISQEATCVPLARTRLTAGIKPGRRGSANLGDCLITEQLLELSRQLRSAGFTREILFVSSNAKDYGASTLKAPLDFQFSSLMIDFYQDVQGAMTQIGF